VEGWQVKTISVARLRQFSRPLRRIARDIGIAGVAGCALMTAGLLTTLYLQFGAAPATPVHGGVAAKAAPAPETPNSPLTPAKDINAAVLRLFAAADENKLALLEGDYRLASSADARYRTYTISLPLKGNYPSIRTFLAQCLRNDPRLALDALEFRRDQIADENLQVRVKLSLFLGAS
jgi:hypothetical protein